MSLLHVPLTTLIHKMATYNPCRVTSLYDPFLFYIYGGGECFFFDINMEKPGISYHFPKGTESPTWFLITSNGTK